jgi:hypothetical protein
MSGWLPNHIFEKQVYIAYQCMFMQNTHESYWGRRIVGGYVLPAKDGLKAEVGELPQPIPLLLESDETIQAYIKKLKASTECAVNYLLNARRYPLSKDGAIHTMLVCVNLKSGFVKVYPQAKVESAGRYRLLALGVACAQRIQMDGGSRSPFKRVEIVAERLSTVAQALPQAQQDTAIKHFSALKKAMGDFLLSRKYPRAVPKNCKIFSKIECI